MAILPKIKAFQFGLSRRVLHSWIRPTILGCNRENLGLTEDDIVCYVMPFRSTADLLVVDKACEAGDLPLPTAGIPELEEDRAFFFMGHAEGTLGRRSLRHQSERMARLFEHQADKPDTSIKIVPVSLFWGHQPDREQSIFKLLLSENWTATGRAKKFLAGLFHRHHILVQYSPPIDLAELMTGEADRELQTRKLRRLLRVHFNRQKQAILGPDLSHRRTLINTILESPEVREAIEREARLEETPFLAVEKKALGYAEEIASDVSYRVIRFFDVLLTWLWNKLYDGIEVNGIDTVKELAQSCELIYTPCHRSHIDYLLLSYVLYHNGLTPPHIAAGRNLNLPVIGPLLRRAGAFYMRRSFRGDALYKEVFDEYLHQVFTRGYSVEYFIEGGRSRTGRTLNPRTGMLSMTLRSFKRDSTKPIAFLPVYFGYERVLESSTYRKELAGSDKETESIFDVFKIFSSFRHAFGEVTVNFGEPVLLADFLEKENPDWQNMSQQAFSAACVDLASTLAARINAATAIKSTNLVALAMLTTPRQSIEEEHLKDHIQLLIDIARGCGPDTLSFTDLSLDEMVEEALSITGLNRTEHQFGSIISATQVQAVNLTYNANNIVHIYALPSLIARLVRVRRATNLAEVTAYCRRLFPFIEAEMFPHYGEAGLPAQVEQVVRVLTEMDLIQTSGQELTAPLPATAAYNSLHELARISDPTIERFYIVLALLADGMPSNRELEVAASGVAEQLSALYGINSPDFFERALFSTFLTTLKQQSLLSPEESSLAVASGFDELESVIAGTMDPDVRHNVLQAVANRQ